MYDSLFLNVAVTDAATTFSLPFGDLGKTVVIRYIYIQTAGVLQLSLDLVINRSGRNFNHYLGFATIGAAGARNEQFIVIKPGDDVTLAVDTTFADESFEVLFHYEIDDGNDN